MTIYDGGSLGLCIDEERSKMRYVVWIAEFSESSNLWTQIALLGIPGSTSAWVALKPMLAKGGSHESCLLDGTETFVISCFITKPWCTCLEIRFDAFPSTRQKTVTWDSLKTNFNHPTFKQSSTQKARPTSKPFYKPALKSDEITRWI